jgi:dipeptidase E
MILSPTFEQVKDMGDSKKAPELKDSSALSIVNFYPLPHHANVPFKKRCGKIIA